ncbi:hypothetical protein VTJ49DRAFT_353 [Mycothermus thermophilus]|uniref:CST complex subunit Stn1 N-terminal domain-containing protein n=1 Tax=Humicola insolens TaxID=85995 RepID=A0ABR3VFQ5_HUMIN
MMTAKDRMREKGKTPTNLSTTATTDTSIVSLDPTAPVNPKPLIADILRTDYCVPGSVFLVEGVELCVRVGDESDSDTGHLRQGHTHRRRKRPRRAVRLLLGDGELCIQAFVRSEIHCFVDSGKIYEGCYVRLDKFGLVTVDGPAGSGGAKGKEEKVVYLDVMDMVTVGWNEEYLKILGRSKEREGVAAAAKTGRTGGDVTGRGGENSEVNEDLSEEDINEGENEDDFREEGDELDEEEEEELMRLVDGHEPARPTTADSEPPPSHQPSKTEPDGRKEEEEDYLSDSDSVFETLVVSVERAHQRRAALSLTQRPTRTRAEPGQQEHQQDQAHRPQQQQQEQNDHQQQQQKQQTHQRIQPQPPPAQQPPIPNPKPRPWLPTSPTTPVKLTTLSQIPHLPYRQNWMVNLLAVISWISPHVEPSHIPPTHLQRAARLVDPTIIFTPVNNDTATTKENGILLTVHLNPDTFRPAPGTVVLLLGVKNHHAEGGSLRKYVSDALAGGASWWVESPEEKGEEEGLGWCRERALGLREWWDGLRS